MGPGQRGGAAGGRVGVRPSVPPAWAAATLVAAASLAGCAGGGPWPSAPQVPDPPGLPAPPGPRAGGTAPAAAWGPWRPGPPRVLGDPRTSGLPRWPGAFEAAPIRAYDFDGDGDLEVTAHANDTFVYVFDAATGLVLARWTTTYPPGWNVGQVLNAAEPARLSAGEAPSVVVANPAASVGVWTLRGAQSGGELRFERRWEAQMPWLGPVQGQDARSVLADLDGDGSLELVVHTEGVGAHALRSDGGFLWSLRVEGGNAAPAVGDLDGDGRPEVVLASDQGVVTVVEGATGRVLWRFDAARHAPWPASIPVAPTLAELDGAPPLEVVFTTRDAHDPGRWDQNHLTVFAVRGRDGAAELVWQRRPAWAAPLSTTHLAAVDVDGDGRPELLGMDWNTLGHLPGNWERTGPAHAFALSATGEERWVRELDAWWSNKDLAVADVDADGRLEVVANGARLGLDGLWALDAATGKPEAFVPVAPWKVARGPVLADLGGDGTMQLLLSVVAEGTPERGSLLVFDLGVAWRAPWPGAPPGPQEVGP